MKRTLIAGAICAIIAVPAFAQSAGNMSSGEVMVQMGIDCSQKIQNSDYQIDLANDCKSVAASITNQVRSGDASMTMKDRNIGVLGAMITYQTIGTAEDAANMKSTSCISYQQALDLVPFYLRGQTPDFDETFDSMVNTTQEFRRNNGC